MTSLKLVRQISAGRRHSLLLDETGRLASVLPLSLPLLSSASSHTHARIHACGRGHTHTWTDVALHLSPPPLLIRPLTHRSLSLSPTDLCLYLSPLRPPPLTSESLRLPCGPGRALRRLPAPAAPPGAGRVYTRVCSGGAAVRPRPGLCRRRARHGGGAGGARRGVKAGREREEGVVGGAGCVWAFGCGDNGRLGLGNTESRFAPEVTRTEMRER